MPAGDVWRGYEIVDLTGEFARFQESSMGLPVRRRVTEFKAYFDEVFPGFYDASRIPYFSAAEYDAAIASALLRFPDRRAALEARARRFLDTLPSALRSFVAVFPDLAPIGEVYVLYSLGEFDGAVRSIAGRRHLIFGIDVMEEVHDFEDETPFFHHELFHVYHDQHFPACEKIGCALWTEGLAVAAAATLDPDATDAQLLLTSPRPIRAAVEANLEEAVCSARGRLNSESSDDYAALFAGGPPTGRLPPRYGYYLGLLVVREAMRDAPLRDLARLGEQDALAVVQRSLDRLATCPAPSPGGTPTGRTEG